MRPVLLATAVTATAALGSALLVAPASAAAPVTVLHATLSGAQEVPGPGDPDAKGNAVLRVTAATGEICYKVVTHGTDPILFGHIHHKAPGTQSGAVVQPLEQVSDSSFRGCVVNPDVAQGLLEEPSEYYVNVHSTTYQGGALRGDLG